MPAARTWQGGCQQSENPPSRWDGTPGAWGKCSQARCELSGCSAPLLFGRNCGTLAP